MNADQFADSVSVFDQNLADLNDYGDGLDRNGARSNELYAGLPLKDEPFEFIDDHRFDPLRPFSDLDAEVAALSSTASTSNDNGFHRPQSTMYGMLRDIESPTLNLSQVIEWSDYFSNATKTENETDTTTVDQATATKAAEQNATENYRNVRVKLESEGDDDHQSSSDDGKNSTSGFSSNVELTEEVTKESKQLLYDISHTRAHTHTNISIDVNHAALFSAWTNNKCLDKWKGIKINRCRSTMYYYVLIPILSEIREQFIAIQTK